MSYHTYLFHQTKFFRITSQTSFFWCKSNDFIFHFAKSWIIAMCHPVEPCLQADNFIFINFHHYSLMIHFVIISAKKRKCKSRTWIINACLFSCNWCNRSTVTKFWNQKFWFFIHRIALLKVYRFFISLTSFNFASHGNLVWQFLNRRSLCDKD